MEVSELLRLLPDTQYVIITVQGNSIGKSPCDGCGEVKNVPGKFGHKEIQQIKIIEDNKIAIHLQDFYV